jgi:ADP-ribosylglycohydrolase
MGNAHARGDPPASVSPAAPSNSRITDSLPQEGKQLYYSGTILGLAVGDSLGFGVEGNPPKECQKHAKTLRKLLSTRTETRDNKKKGGGSNSNSDSAVISDSGIRNTYFPLGQVTDDTQLTRCVRSAGFSPSVSTLSHCLSHAVFGPNPCMSRCLFEALLDADAECETGTTNDTSVSNSGGDDGDAGDASTSASDRASRATAHPFARVAARKFAERVSQMYKDHLLVGCGMATAKALSRLLRPNGMDDPEAAGSPVGEAGNSPAIRAVAVGLFFAHRSERHDAASGSQSPIMSLDLMFEVAKTQARVTHLDVRCQVAACLIAYVVRQMLLGSTRTKQQHSNSGDAGVDSSSSDAADEAGGEIPRVTIDAGFGAGADFSVGEFVSRVREECLSVVDAEDEAGFAGHLALFTDSFVAKTRVGDAARRLRTAGLSLGFDDGTVGISGFVVTTVVWSLYCFLKFRDSFADGLFACLGAGGDTDSTCALAGALLGARNSAAQIPDLFLRLLRDQEIPDSGAAGLGRLVS